MPKIYISGKITGLSNYKEIFKQAEVALTAEGHSVINPAEVMPDGFDYEDYMSVDFALIRVCDSLYVLNNWRDSPGAIREVEYAGRLGKAIMFEGD